ncbi:uncharacterized protein TNCV_4913171 [Trichonephila clavipes]|nr:uncharacterized protein TNCV_4913171 [Trichonephila clavipes]
MFIQPTSSQPGLVRGTAVLLENSITVRITEQNKRIERIAQQIYVKNCIEGGCLPSALSSRNRDSLLHAIRFQSSTLQSHCSLAQANLAARWPTLSKGTVVGRWFPKPIRFATTKEIKSQLQDINVNASERTVRRKLKDLNFKTCCPTRKPKLTPAMKAKRLNWAKQWHDKDEDFWRSVCFSNESTFEILQNKAQFVRRRRGEKFHSDCVVQTVKHPTKIMIWSVISGKGTGRLYVVKGMMRQDQYKDVLQNRLISQLKE